MAIRHELRRNASQVRIAVALLAVALTIGCAIKQEVSPLETAQLREMCIVEHADVREGVLEALQEGFERNGIATRVIPGEYYLLERRWRPRWDEEDATGCDAMCFYQANWTWDVTTYMYFANFWITPPDDTDDIRAMATYDASAAGGSPRKFINAREKILEMVDEMMGATP